MLLSVVHQQDVQEHHAHLQSVKCLNRDTPESEIGAEDASYNKSMTPGHTSCAGPARAGDT